MMQSHSKNTLSKIIGPAKVFHSHLGPFLVIGLRMGLIGLQELGAPKGAKDLRVTAYLTYTTPISCILDGLQITTSCTLGNTRLKVRKSKNIYAAFTIKKGDCVTIRINPVKFRKMRKKLLGKTLSIQETETLSYKIASIPESDLFIIDKQ